MKTGESIELTPHMVPSFTSIEKKTVNCVSIVYKEKKTFKGFSISMHFHQLKAKIILHFVFTFLFVYHKTLTNIY